MFKKKEIKIEDKPVVYDVHAVYDEMLAHMDEEGCFYVYDNEFEHYYRYEYFEYFDAHGWNAKPAICCDRYVLNKEGYPEFDTSCTVYGEEDYERFFGDNDRTKPISAEEFNAEKQIRQNEYMESFKALDIFTPYYYFGHLDGMKEERELYEIRIDGKYTANGQNWVVYSVADKIRNPRTFTSQPVLEWNSFRKWYTPEFPENFESRILEVADDSSISIL